MKRLFVLLLVAILFTIGCATEEVIQQDDIETAQGLDEHQEEDHKDSSDEDEKETSIDSNTTNASKQKKTSKNESKKSPKLDPLTVHYIDAGQGDATLIQVTDDADTYTILYDVGDWQGSEVVPYLQKENIDFIDIVIISHPHADHIGQLEDVLQTFEVGEIWMTGNTANSNVYERAAEAVLASDADYSEPEVGDVFDIGELTLQILHPSTLTGGLNEDSLSVHFSYGDIAFLFTGDAYVAQEKQMIELGLDIEADFLQLGHHGSNTSTSQAFIDAVNPTYAIYSAGSGNSYGHPHEVVLQRLESKNVKTYGTDVHGDIVVTTDGKDAEINTEKDGKVTAGKKNKKEKVKDKPEKRAKPKNHSATDCIDINDASKTELQHIIHIGEKRADDVIDLRPFNSVKDLQRVNGIGPARIDDIIDENIACTGG